MIYLIFLPVIFLAVILKLIFDRSKIKALSFVMKIIIIAGIVLFIYFLLDYYGYNIFDMIRDFIFSKFF